MDDIWTTDQVFGDVPARRKTLANELFAGKTVANIKDLADRGTSADPDVWGDLVTPAALVDLAERNMTVLWDVLHEMSTLPDIREWIDPDGLTLESESESEFLTLAAEAFLTGLALEAAYGSTTADADGSEPCPGGSMS